MIEALFVSPRVFNFALIGELVLSSFMTGLIWLIQLVHYPTFAHVPEAEFARFHAFHSSKITFIVAPVMVAELALGFLLSTVVITLSLAKATGHSTDVRLSLVNLIGLLAIWLATFAVSVPLHNRLGRERSEETIRRLVSTNWLRTLLWSARTALLVYWLMYWLAD